MNKILLLGDSIIDNKSYVTGLSTDQHIVKQYPNDTIIMRAVDGAKVEDVYDQLPEGNINLKAVVLSIGGNDALDVASQLNAPTRTVGEGLIYLYDHIRKFEARYTKLLSVITHKYKGVPVIACTIYEGNHSDRNMQKAATVGVKMYNDVIYNLANQNTHVSVYELRDLFKSYTDYANPIEPSSTGSEKFANMLKRYIPVD